VRNFGADLLWTGADFFRSHHIGIEADAMKELLAGAHMSIAGGMYRALERGASAGCRTIQVFLKNSNRWAAKPLTEQDRDLFREAQERSAIRPVLAHDSYLINLASPDHGLYEKSVAAFIDEMRRADFLGIPYLVLHPGAHMGSGLEAAMSRVARALDRAVKEVGPSVTVLLENTAGQGSCIGHRFEHLAAILKRMADPARAGLCLDTCHMFAAGYDIRTAKDYRKTMRDFDRVIGPGALKAIHVNDSRKGLGSRVDRHCHIGQGCIGLEAFRCLVNDRRFAGIPKILETPKGPDLEEDRMNLKTLRSLMK
jgi:deoxyribonuclease-4